MGYAYLQNRLQNLWQLTEKINLIDLSEDYYLIKLTKTENYEKNPTPGSMVHWTSVRIDSQMETQIQSIFATIWIRLPKLPNEFYDLNILQKIENQIGTILKLDTVTMNATRGRHARLCILALISKPLPIDILIGTPPSKNTLRTLYTTMHLMWKTWAPSTLVSNQTKRHSIHVKRNCAKQKFHNYHT